MPVDIILPLSAGSFAFILLILGACVLFEFWLKLQGTDLIVSQLTDIDLTEVVKATLLVKRTVLQCSFRAPTWLVGY